MNKIFTKIIIALLSVSLFCVCPSVLADVSGAVLITPENGDRVDISALTAKVYLSEDITGAYVSLDGEAIADIQTEEGITEYEIPYSVDGFGSHTMTLVAKGNDGIVSDVSEFAVYGVVDENVTDYGFSESSSLEYYIAQRLGGGVAGYSKRSVTSGTDGTERWAVVTFNSRDAGNDPIFIRYAGSELNGKIKVCIRAKTMQTNDSFMIRLEGIGDITVFGKNGKIGTSDEAYEADVWYDICVNVDTLLGICTTYAGDVLADSREITASGFKAVRLYMSGNNNDNAQYMIDNFRIDRTHTTPSVTAIKSVTDGEENGDVLADADKIRFYFDSLPSETNSDLSKFKLISETAEIQICEASADKNGNYIDICAEKLSENTAYTLLIDMSVFYPGNDSQVPYSAGFKTALGGFGAESFGFCSGDTKLITSQFINPGDSIGVYASMINRTDEDRTATLIICSYEGDDLTAISAKSAVIPQNTVVPVEIKTDEISYPSGEDAYVRASIINSWASPYAVVAPIDF